MNKLIKEDIARAKKFHGTFRFINDLCALNDGREFQMPYKEIYPKEVVLKLEHSGSHTTFLEIEYPIRNGKISPKVYKKRDDFSFFILRIPEL